MAFTQIYTLINDIGKEALGTQAPTVKDTTSFVSFGDLVLDSSQNKDAFYKVLVDRIGKTLVAIRAYRKKSRQILRSEVEWGLFTQKIHFKKIDSVPNPAFAAGTVNGTNIVSPYNTPTRTEAIQKLFASHAGFAYEDAIPDNLFTAFLSETAMAAFISGIRMNMQNQLEQDEEDLENLAVATGIAYTIQNGTQAQVRYLLDEYNQTIATPLTVNQAKTDPGFLAYEAKEMSRQPEKMEGRFAGYNAELLPKSTPRDRIVIDILADEVENLNRFYQSNVFHDTLVSYGDAFNKINYWQTPGEDYSRDECSKINIKHNALITPTNATGEVEASNIVAVFRDIDAVAATLRKLNAWSVYDGKNERLNYGYNRQYGFGFDSAENFVVFAYTATAA